MCARASAAIKSCKLYLRSARTSHFTYQLDAIEFACIFCRCALGTKLRKLNIAKCNAMMMNVESLWNCDGRNASTKREKNKIRLCFNSNYYCKVTNAKLEKWKDAERTQKKKNGNHIWEHHKSYACNFGAVMQNERAQRSTEQNNGKERHRTHDPTIK